MTYRELEILLKKNGWYHERTNGSHYIFKHRTISGSIPVPHHKGDIKKGTLKSILKKAKIEY